MEKYDYSKLRGKIREVYFTEHRFAKALGLSKMSLSTKLNGHIEFSQGEIEKAVGLLGIDPRQVSEYFLTRAVGRKTF